jgi:hypothetical protein
MSRSIDALRRIEGATVRAPEFDALFAPQAKEYLGADCALSVPIDEDRVVWVFGDTLLGDMSTGRRVIHAMPRNTVAVQRISQGLRYCGSFAYPLVDGRPETTLRLPELHPDEWFWAGTGIMFEGTLLIFGYGVVHRDSDCEALAFRVIRNWVARVRNPADDPLRWEINWEPYSDVGATALFGSACYLDDVHLYLLGYRRVERDYTKSRVALARVPRERLLSRGLMDAMEYWGNGVDGPEWLSQPDDLVPLLAPANTESSLYYDAPRKRFITTCYPSRTPEYLVSTAPALTGPWAEPMIVFEAAEHAPVADFLSYTFRMHPHLSSDADNMVLTYVVNPCDPSRLADRTDMYYPKFVRLDLTAIP